MDGIIAEINLIVSAWETEKRTEAERRRVELRRREHAVVEAVREALRQGEVPQEKRSNLVGALEALAEEADEPAVVEQALTLIRALRGG